jgi:hypothetical protein
MARESDELLPETEFVVTIEKDVKGLVHVFEAHFEDELFV